MTQLSRRTVVKGMAAAGAVAAFPAIAACGDSSDDNASSSSSGGGKKEVGTVTLGSNQSDPIPRKAYAELFGEFEKQSGGTVKINRRVGVAPVLAGHHAALPRAAGGPRHARVHVHLQRLFLGSRPDVHGR